MIGYDVDGGAGPFEVVSPLCVIDSRKLFVVDVVIGLGVFKRSGVKCDQMIVAVWGAYGYSVGHTFPATLTHQTSNLFTPSNT